MDVRRRSGPVGADAYASNRRAVNFYLWRSEEWARMFFNDQMVKRVTDLYGVPPRVDFVDIAALVNNGQ